MFLVKTIIWFLETWLILVYLIFLLPAIFVADLINGSFKQAKEGLWDDIIDITKVLFKFKRGIW